MSISKQNIESVIVSLENTNYKWRTLNGVSEETGLPPDTVLEIIKDNKSIIIQSAVPSLDGKELFTTRKHYLKLASPMQKILGALKNRLD